MYVVLTFVALLFAVLILTSCLWILSHQTSLLSPRTYAIIGLAIAMAWSIVFDLDAIIEPNNNFIGLFIEYPYRALIYRLPLLLGVVATVIELAVRDIWRWYERLGCGMTHYLDRKNEYKHDTIERRSVVTRFASWCWDRWTIRVMERASLSNRKDNEPGKDLRVDAHRK